MMSIKLLKHPHKYIPKPGISNPFPRTHVDKSALSWIQIKQFTDLFHLENIPGFQNAIF